MSGKTTMLTSSKTVPATASEKQGKFRWSITYANGKTIDKYNADGTKNVYAERTKALIPLENASSISLTDAEGKQVTSLNVPEGAVVFQRRRGSWGAGGLRINYFNQWHDVVEVVDGFYDKSRKAWIPEHAITRHVPEVNYEEVWLIGWRKREADNSVTVQFAAVYPDGKVDLHNGFNEKPWLYEPQWKTEEQV